MSCIVTVDGRKCLVDDNKKFEIVDHCNIETIEKILDLDIWCKEYHLYVRNLKNKEMYMSIIRSIKTKKYIDHMNVSIAMNIDTFFEKNKSTFGYFYLRGFCQYIIAKECKNLHDYDRMVKIGDESIYNGCVECYSLLAEYFIEKNMIDLATEYIYDGRRRKCIKCENLYLRYLTKSNIQFS